MSLQWCTILIKVNQMRAQKARPPLTLSGMADMLVMQSEWGIWKMRDDGSHFGYRCNNDSLLSYISK